MSARSRGMLQAGIRRASKLKLNHILLMIVGGGLAALTAERLWLAQGLPLWLDETWTAMIVGQPTWRDFWRQVWLDCNAPLYYLVMRPWTALAGQSDWALRIPSLVFVTLAGLLPVFWRPREMTRETALTWAGLLCLWSPGVAVSLDARPYGLLLLFAVAQTIAFARVLDRPDLRRAALWSGLASLAILTHYYTLYLAGVQGLLLLAFRRPWRIWPAALLFLPAFAWLAIHLPRLTDYARPDIAWYQLVSWGSLGDYIRYALGPDWGWFPLAVALIAGYCLVRKRPRPSMLWVVAGAGFLALALMLAAGAVRPTLTPRYVVPMVPSVLLTLALVTRRSAPAGILLLALYAAATLSPEHQVGKLQSRAAYGYQRQSEWLMKAKPDQLVFGWDNPVNEILDKDSLTQVGRFFFHRAGNDIETKTLIIGSDEDPHTLLAQAADGQRPAIIWLYNSAPGTAAGTHPPHDIPGWRCMARSDRRVGSLACVRDQLDRFPHTPGPDT